MPNTTVDRAIDFLHVTLLGTRNVVDREYALGASDDERKRLLVLRRTLDAMAKQVGDIRYGDSDCR